MKKISDESEIESYDFTKTPYSNRMNEINSNFLINEIRRRSLSAGNNNKYSSDRRNITQKTFDKNARTTNLVAMRKLSMQQIVMPISCLICVCCTILLIWRTIELEKRLTEMEIYLKNDEQKSKMKFDDNLMLESNLLNTPTNIENISKPPKSATSSKRCVCTPGPPGATGPQGLKGEEGPMGLPGVGPPGPKGDSGILSYPVMNAYNHLPQADKMYGSEPTKEPSALYYNVPVPVKTIKGEPGAPGQPGSPGLTGPKGTKGEPGYDGRSIIGPKGEMGSNGPPGNPGPEGPPGSAGPKGSRGDKGALVTLNGKSAFVEGPPGPQGASGPKGDKGDSGMPGLPGEKGKRGKRGKDGSKGENGKAGDPGQNGEPGLPGTKGHRGERGKSGSKGKIGSRGEKGEQGIPGLDAPCPLGSDGLPLPGCGWKPIKVEHETRNL